MRMIFWLRKDIRRPLLLWVLLVAMSGAACADRMDMVSVNKHLQVVAADGEYKRDWHEGASYAEGGLLVPRLFQKDYTNTLVILDGDGKSVESSGCAAVCLSMALAYLYLELPQSPETIFRDACLAGLYQGNGFNLSSIKKLGEGYGIEVQQVGRYPGAVRTALMKGFPVIAYMGKGLFSNGGHYILLRGFAEEDDVYVNDPNSRERSDRAYPLSVIVEQTRSSNPFLICKPVSSTD